jgi:hypothetical protein
MWPSVVVHEHWPVNQRMIVEMGDYAWSEHIVAVFLACQITIKNVQVQLTVKGKTTPDSYTPTPKSSCAWNEVFRWRQTLARSSVGCSQKRLSSDQWSRLHVRIVHPKWSCDQSNRAWWWCNVNCERFMGRRTRIPWWWRRLITVCVLMWPPNAKLPRSAPAVLNGCCRARLDMSRSSLRCFARSTCTWTVSNIPRLTKTLHQSYNDGMVNPEVVCHPSMDKTTVMHANSLPPFWYG